MPLPSSIADLSQTAGSNSPAGSESPTTADDYLRTYAAYIAQHRDGSGFAQEATVASAATADIGAATSMYVQITGTTTITSFGANYNGPRFVRFAAALTLTHNATTLILPGAANITTAAGDTALVVPNGNAASGWRVAAYTRAALVPGTATPTDGSVTTAKIVDANVTTAKIADSNVTTAKIADANVTTVKIADAHITAAKLDGAQSGSAPIYAARAWVNFNGTGTVAIRASGNVSSITDLAVGQYEVNFSTAMSDVNYCVSGSTGNDSSGGANLRIFTSDTTNRTTSKVGCLTSTAGSNADNGFVQVAIFR